MLKLFKTSEKTFGTPPGTLFQETETAFTATGTSYSETELEHSECKTVEDCIRFIERKDTYNWLNVTGKATNEVLRAIGDKFGVHDLVLEDIQNISEPSKFEEFDDFIFIVAKLLTLNPNTGGYSVGNIKLIISENTIITFNSVPVPIYLKLFKRISLKNTKIRKMGISYFLFALLDVLSDSNYQVLNKVIDKAEQLEISLQKDFRSFDATEIYQIKQFMSYAKRSVWGFTEIVNNIKVNDFLPLEDSMLPYYQDLEDHHKHMIEIIEFIYLATTDMFNLYISLNTQQMNEVMKMLTIFSAIFIPITFIASFYGMNFPEMPLLKQSWGYTITACTMIVIAVSMLLYFRRRKWF